MRNLRILSLITILFSILLFGQNIMNIKSPQSFEMERYGNIPINMNTGSIDLSIPLFNDKIVGSNFNIDLVYNSSGFLPAKKSNYVGSNWFLNFGGAITREVRGIDDDSRFHGNNMYGYLAGLRKYTKTNNDIYFGNFVQGIGTYSAELKGTLDISGNNYQGYAELMPDKFNFNFMGKKGYFYIGNDGTPLIFSNDSNMKIDLSGVPTQYSENCLPDASEIKITDGDGIVYYFGGSYNNLEVYTDMGVGALGALVQTRDRANKNYITAWYLRMISFPNGKNINFQYKKFERPQDETNTFCFSYNTWKVFEGNNPNGGSQKYIQPFYDLNINVNQIKKNTDYNFDYSWGGYNVWGNGSSSSNSGVMFTFSFIKKVLPERITYDSTEILFNYNKYERVTDPSNSNLGDFNSFKLADITVKNAGSIVDKINFEYFRNKFYFFLTGLKINENAYSFDYYKKDDTLPLPYTYGVDFLGYWNGGGDTTNKLIPEYGLDSSTSDFNLIGTSRNPSTSVFDATLLKRLIYPTKGYSDFIYEPHEYSKKIDRNSSSQFLPVVIEQNGIVGGARIQKIIDFDGSTANTREYKYLKNYLPNSQSNISSGISNSYIRFFELLRYQTALPNGVQNTSSLTETANNIVPTTFNNSPINYTEVTEILNGRFNKKFLFSGIDTIKDSLIVRKTNYSVVTTKNYLPPNLAENMPILFNDQSEYRGQLQKTIFYSNGQVIKEVENKYTKLLSINKFPYKFVSRVQSNRDWINFYKEYVYPSLLSSTITKDYLNGSVIQTKTECHYDNMTDDNLTSQTTIFPDKTLTISYSYPRNLGKQYLLDKNILNIPLVTENIETQNNISKTISKTEIVYPASIADAKSRNVDDKDRPVPFDLFRFSMDIQSSSMSNEVKYDKYDGNGNPVQYSTKLGIPTTIIWGYNNTKPIAKIEGATYPDPKNPKSTDISKSLMTTLATASDADAALAPRSDESIFLTALNTFRNDPSLMSYQITTFTYDPLIGVRSITSPNGITEFYKYDNENKLEIILDKDNNIIKEFKYHYSTNTFYNYVRSQTFTKNNCPSYQNGTNYTYMVPANKYMSTINQADADQQAQTEINQNGQNVANSTGSCSNNVCSITPADYIIGYSSSTFEQTSENHIKATIYLFVPPSSLGLAWGSGVNIGNLGTSCRPYGWKDFKNIVATSGSSVWDVTVWDNGSVVLYFKGNSSPPYGNTVVLKFEYDK